MSDEKSLGVQRATTCRYSDCDLPIVACAFYSVAMASDCERCDNYKPRSEEAEAMKCPECGADMTEDDDENGTPTWYCRRPSCRYEEKVKP